jgi:hypothetical protein
MNLISIYVYLINIFFSVSVPLKETQKIFRPARLALTLKLSEIFGFNRKFRMSLRYVILKY